MSFTCKLWKVTLLVQYGDNGLIPVAPTEETKVYWGYNFNESRARDAAIRWAEANAPQAIVNISRVDEIK